MKGECDKLKSIKTGLLQKMFPQDGEDRPRKGSEDYTKTEGISGEVCFD